MAESSKKINRSKKSVDENNEAKNKLQEIFADKVSDVMTQAMMTEEERKAHEEIEKQEKEDEIMKDMITNYGAIYYYDGELADMSKLSIVNKSFVIFNIEKQTPVLVNGGVLKLDSRDGAIAVCQVLINIYGVNLVVYPFEEIKDMGLIL